MNDNEVREECLRLLRDDPPIPVPALPEDGPVGVPLYRDVDGDIAAVMFLRGQIRPGRSNVLYTEIWTFQRRDGDWQHLGGGGGSAPDAPLIRHNAADLGGHLRCDEWGSTVRNANRLLPWGAKYVHEAHLLASDEVAQIRLDRRTLEVPGHGHVVAVWGSRRAPRAEALAADGTVLEVLELDRSNTAAHI